MCGRSARIVRSTCLRALGRVQRALARADLVRVGDAGLVLLLRRRALVERLDEQLGAERRSRRGASVP